MLGIWPHWPDQQQRPLMQHRSIACDIALCNGVHSFLNHIVLSLWQDKWANTQSNTLRMLKSVQSFFLQHCQEGGSHAVMLTCLQIIRMHLTHCHLLHGEPAPVCVNCHVPLTVSHILVNFPHYGEACCVYCVHSTLSNMLAWW